jgi:hypothetical protein
VRHAGRGSSSNCITLAIAGMRRCSTVWCYVRAATKPSTPVTAVTAMLAGASSLARFEFALLSKSMPALGDVAWSARRGSQGARSGRPSKS